MPQPPAHDNPPRIMGAMRLEDFDFELPAELIAQAPAAARTASRLLHLNGKTGALADAQFTQLPVCVARGDVMVFNDTRVIKARLCGAKESGGKIEVLIERILAADRALAQVRASHSPRVGSRLTLAGDTVATMLGRQGEFFELRFEACTDIYALLEQYGSVPLPPYITHTADAVDETRYQTVYARTPGAVAAPTAGLHFDAEMLQALQQSGVVIAHVTLHVGAGTFQPVRVSDLSEHQMHREWYEVPQATVDAIHAARARGSRVMAVGTTSLRALESAAESSVRKSELKAGTGDTRLFITPGYTFKVVDRLLTNFHLPKSTLLMLVSAFAGVDNVRRAYRHAIAQRYRFFSYGDAMLIERQ
ncbi:MAG TPA: tRNA preQ1(34) S-adenosylmethionine ribosyltransferase-isomerase QueA [Burkholderiales bacterium]|nr:tRNA preQ1(34) S-adenosylmethionine ribosyltransferase-isomerase QueA [Burkholderiales bacterium]